MLANGGHYFSISLQACHKKLKGNQKENNTHNEQIGHFIITYGQKVGDNCIWL